jgi:ComF family protein
MAEARGRRDAKVIGMALVGWREWANAALDLFFPPLCPLCRARLDDGRRDPLCGGCWNGLERLSPPYCQICGRPFEVFEPSLEDGRRCEQCRRRRPPFAYARAATLYKETAREALHAFKFGGKRSMARPLGEVMALAGEASGLVEAVDCLVPVPLHGRRQAERGFNQSALLARHLGRRWRRPVVESALRRTTATRPQTDLGADERRKNVRGAFALRRPEPIVGRHVLLIDDILTTGATVSECTRVLLEGGAKTVGVLTVARVP